MTQTTNINVDHMQAAIIGPAKVNRHAPNAAARHRFLVMSEDFSIFGSNAFIEKLVSGRLNGVKQRRQPCELCIQHTFFQHFLIK